MPRPLQTEDLLGFEMVGEVAMAPGGERVAHIVSRINRESNQVETAIYLAAAGQAPVRFTGGETDRCPRFSPDGSHLAFISRRSGQAQVWVMPLAGGEARQLTRVQGGVGQFAWAPDGSRIAFTAMLRDEGIQPEVKEEKEEKEDDLFKRHTQGVKTFTEMLYKLDGVGYFGQRRPCLCVTALDEGSQPLQLSHPPYRVEEVTWTPDSRRILFTSQMAPDHDRRWWSRVYAIPAAGGEPLPLTPETLSCAHPRVSPDGTTLAFAAHKVGAGLYDNMRLYTVPLAGGEVHALAPDRDRPFGLWGVSDMPAPGEGALTWSPDGQALYALTSSEGAAQLARVEIASGEVRVLTQGERVIFCYDLDTACRKAALVSGKALNPGDLYLLDLPAGTEERLTRVNAGLLAELALSEPRRFHARAAGGPRIDAWVIKPCDLVKGRKYPAVLEIHGGPMMMYTSAFFFEFQLLAAQGYGVIYANSRGSQGYGEDFCQAIRGDWGNVDYQDLMAVVDQAVADNPWIDQDRLGVTGGSYGGYMTNWIVGQTDRFKAAVTGRSICDLRLLAATGDLSAEWLADQAGGVTYWVDDQRYKAQSPITYVTRVRTPILIEHQEGDLRCPIDQAMAWYSAIQYEGNAPVRLVTYPDEFHGMSRNGKPWHRVHRLREILGWFDTHLKAEAGS